MIGKSMTRYKYIKVTPIATAIGAEISGVDISIDIPKPVISEIRQALLEYLVIFFRDQDLSDPERHRSFSKRFGHLFVHPNFTKLEETKFMENCLISVAKDYDQISILKILLTLL